MPAGARRMRRATWGWLAALLGWTLLMSFYQLDAGAGLEPVDAWVAQTSREMYENIAAMIERAPEEGWRWEPFIIPRFSGEVRMQKSPGAYWVAMTIAWLRGTEVDEVCVRIPNAAAAVILVLTCYWLTRRIAGDRAAVFAGFAAAASGVVLHASRGGSADLPVTALMALSLACIWIGSERTPAGPRRVLLWLSGYLLAGLAMAYKMPLPLVCVGLPAALYVLLRNRWRILASWWHLAGLTLFLLPWLPWMIATVQMEPTALDKWRVEFVDRVTGDLPNVDGQARWHHYFFYVGVALAFALPWTLSVPAALVRPFRRTGIGRGAPPNRDGMLFLWLWFVGLLVFFSVSAGKEARYLLVAMPPLFMLLGVELAAFFNPARPRSERLLRWGSGIAYVLAAAGVIGTAYGLVVFAQRYPDRAYYWDEIWPPLLVCGVILLLGMWLAIELYRRRQPNASFAALVGMMWVLWLWAWPKVMPIAEGQAPSKDFAAQLQRLDAPQRAALRQVAHQDPRIIWYSDIRYPRVLGQLEMLELHGGRRSLEEEIRVVGERMIERLEGDDLVLFVAGAADYIWFHAAAEAELAKLGREMPRTHVWIVGAVGYDLKRYIVFSNRPPPWETPRIPETIEKILEKRRAALRSEAPPVTETRPTEAAETAPVESP